MKATDRRKKILSVLKENRHPISASYLAKWLEVSRQVIVGDVALLRAEGESILATPRGYLMQSCLVATEGTYIRKIACQHGPEDVEKELTILLMGGAQVLDVEIEHPIYGLLTGKLNITSLKDRDRFLEALSHHEEALLSHLTNGVHTHTVCFPSVQAYQAILNELREAGILLEN
ncbi:transcription repressor NadR [Streptococcus ruminantium]|uniref:transcription repressor NadR n=1 Tax=Streptococcus ruminantium TaxID=1917441 RepID=UPI00280D1FA0|nr:transcription repressor NadR [Streptococcus ruminantium]MDQ8836326.1 transcription repressor NadR [Streptococcus ruminantium]